VHEATVVRLGADGSVDRLVGCATPAGEVVDITLRGGRIHDVMPARPGEAPAHPPLVTPALVDVHLHPDKAYLLGQIPGGATLAEAIAAVRANKPAETAARVFERTARLLAECRSYGTLAVRLHAEVDPVLGLRGVEGVLAARDALGGTMSVQVCAFPQEGIVSRPGTMALLRAALAQGADVVGGITYSADPLDEHLAIVTGLARELGCPVDLHADLSLPDGTTSLPEVAAALAAAGLHGRALLGHCTSLPALDDGTRAAVLDQLARVDASLVVMPRTDLFFDGRIASLAECARHGVRALVATNNVQNPFTPVGVPSLPEVAAVYALVHRVGTVAGLAELAERLWAGRALIDGETAAIAAGAVADLCVWPVSAAWELVARTPRPVAVIRCGRVVA
jgi:cytosine/creatinine deaminase